MVELSQSQKYFFIILFLEKDVFLILHVPFLISITMYNFGLLDRYLTIFSKIRYICTCIYVYENKIWLQKKEKQNIKKMLNTTF